jgi:hypothetical protein
MATALPNSNINIPYSAFLDPTTGRPSQAWLQWLMNPSVISINLSSAVSVTSGGTGLTTIPTNGQLLIGNGTGYTLNTLGAGAGISVTNGSGTITVANTGVLSVTGTAPVVSSGGQTPAISLASGYGDTQNPYAAKTANYVLAGPASGAATVPTFRSLVVADIPALPYAPQTSGPSILYGNGTGGFSNVTIGSGISFVSGTLSATASGGTVTSVGGTGTVNGLTLTGTVTSSGNLTLGGTLDLSSPPAIGGTTPAAGTFTTLIGGADAANYGQLTGGATTKAVQFQTLGTDTNISVAVQPKGTGAIDLAAGSRGVNISNGGTVTAITRTAAGSAYTSIPSLAISAPTTAGGVQAVATTNMLLVSATIQSGGTGYTVADALTVVGGTGSAAIITVATVSSGVITGVTINSGGFGNYSVLPTNPVSVTGGTGSSATFNLTSYGLSGNFTISNAGSGYVEQPTVTFSGGGGSGAAAYATVGSGSVIRALGSTSTQALDFHTAASATNTVPTLRLRDVSVGTSNTGFVQVQNNNGYSSIIAQGPTNAGLFIAANGTGEIRFNTNSTIETNQMRVTHTASAVNYVQVTGATTASKVVAISAQGSDADVTLSLSPKGAGTIRFGTYTASALLAVAGYITITDSGGTSRRLLVG